MSAQFGFRREFAAVVGTVLLGFCVCQSPAEAASSDKPNIVFLLADQWRAKATAMRATRTSRRRISTGWPAEHDFRNAVSVCPVCTPYRAALMTGRFPTSTGMFLNDAHLPDHELCMAEIFKHAGYATAYIGKWHLDGHGRSSYIPPERRQGWEYWKAAECDHNYNHSHYYDGTRRRNSLGGLRCLCADPGRAGVPARGRPGDQPFVLMVSYGVPHFPHETAPAELQGPVSAGEDPAAAQRAAGTAGQGAAGSSGYYAHCTALDQCVGDVLATLEETGLARKHDPGVHLGPRRDAGLARLPAAT